jgi:DNA topoisomerase-3
VRLHRGGLSVGRVQTPTLGLVVARDEEIASHTQRVFYDLEASVELETGDCVPFMLKPSKEACDGEAHVFDRSVVERIAEAVRDTHQAVETTVKEEVKHPQLPYNLTVLTADMSKRYGLSAAKTLEITQTLRDDYKAITYNRTDCQYLKEEHFEAARAILPIAMSNCSFSALPVDLDIKHKAFNDANVSAHHAIIPQEICLDIAKMSDDERHVYEAIVFRYALLFLPPEISDVSLSCFPVEEGKFSYKAKRVKQDGFVAYLGDARESEEDEDDCAGKLWVEAGQHEGSVRDTRIIEKKTSPPKPYTEGTLILDMSSISKYVKSPEIKEILKRKDEGKKGESGGIGTTATRAAIIEKLKQRGFLEEAKGKIRSTQIGRDFYHLLPEEIRTADLTALWWLIQEKIAAGKGDVYDVAASTIEVFNAHRDTAYLQGSLGGEVVGVCPCCKKPVVVRGKMLVCSSNRSEKQGDVWVDKGGCGFKLWPVAFGKTLTVKQLAELLNNGETRNVVKGLKSKAGKVFEARLALDKTGRVSCVFPERRKSG